MTRSAVVLTVASIVLGAAACASGSSPSASVDGSVGASAGASAGRSALPSAGPSPSVVAGGSWSVGPPLSTRRTEVAAAVLDGMLYVAGGFPGPGRSLDLVERFDPTSGTWTTVAPLPAPLNHLGLVALHGRIYAVGGYTEPSLTRSAGVWAYDPATDRWTPRAELPAARGAAATAVVDGRIYVVGGTSPVNGVDVTLAVYEPATDTWQDLPAKLPTVREHLVGVELKGELWVIGGRYVGNLSVVEIYDPRTGEWRTGPPLPVATSGHTAVVLDGSIHVTGGEDGDAYRTIAAHQVFDPAVGSWQLFTDLPRARHGLGSGVIDGRWYVAAGGPAPDLSVSDRLDIWTPD